MFPVIVSCAPGGDEVSFGGEFNKGDGCGRATAAAVTCVFWSHLVTQAQALG